MRAGRHDAGMRLDVFTSLHLPDVSRNFIAGLIKDGHIRVDGAVRKPGYRISANQEISGSIPAPEPTTFHPEPLPIDIRYEDSDVIVVNKAPGMVVHPAPGHTSGTLVNALLYHCADLSAIGGEIRPGIVHRLDKDTSGTMVVAKSARAHEHLSMQFKDRRVEKTYLALISGDMAGACGEINQPIGRHPSERKKMSVHSPKAREARTRWRVRKRYDGYTLLDVDLLTGRTHQIRVHCASIGRPILGDPVYGGRAARKIPAVHRQMLHAWRLAFTHPVTGRKMQFSSRMPDDMVLVLRTLAGATTRGA